MKLDVKTLKKILQEQREEFQRYTGVLAESFASQIKLSAESLSGLQEQLIAVRDMVAKNTENIEIMKIDTKTTKEDIEIIKTDIHVIKDGLTEKIGRIEFKALERRIELLER